MNIPAIVITGPRRSGTHLLYRLLDGHPELSVCLTEAYLLEYVKQLSPRALDGFIKMFFELDTHTLFDLIEERELLPLYRTHVAWDEALAFRESFAVPFDEQRMAERINVARRETTHDLQGIWDTWFAALQSVLRSDGDLLPTVIKSPDYGLSARSAIEELQNSKALFVVRHPLFSISSMRKLRQRQPRHWNLTTSRMLTELSRIDDLHRAINHLTTERADRVKVVRFEDLVTDTGPTLRSVADFLGIEFNDILLEPTLNGETWHGDSSFDKHHGVSAKAVDPSRIVLGPAEVDLVFQCLPGFMADFGYDRPKLR